MTVIANADLVAIVLIMPTVVKRFAPFLKVLNGNSGSICTIRFFGRTLLTVRGVAVARNRKFGLFAEARSSKSWKVGSNALEIEEYPPCGSGRILHGRHDPAL